MPKKSTPIIKLKDVKPIEFVSTGVKELDAVCRGYPRGRVSQIYGLSSVGKSTLMAQCMAAISKDHKILYLDVENAINVERFKQLGADLDKVDYSNLNVLEEVCELVRANIGLYDLIMLDSVAMLVPRAEHNGETGEQFVGLKPRLLGQFLRQLEGDLGKSKTALVLINQMRRSMDMYGDKFVLPGGLQLKFSSSLMIQLVSNSADKLMDGKLQIGHVIHAKVTKSKVSQPYLETKFKLIYLI